MFYLLNTVVGVCFLPLILYLTRLLLLATLVVDYVPFVKRFATLFVSPLIERLVPLSLLRLTGDR